MSLASLREVCQFVYDGYEKMPDAANDEGAVHQYEEFTTEWSVRVSGGRETAEAIAERHGFINNGPVSRVSSSCAFAIAVYRLRKTKRTCTHLS